MEEKTVGGDWVGWIRLLIEPCRKQGNRRREEGQMMTIISHRNFDLDFISLGRGQNYPVGYPG